MTRTAKVLAVVVLGLGILLSALSAHAWSENHRSELQARFDRLVGERMSRLSAGMRSYENALVAQRALYAVDEDVDLAEFRRFVASLDLDRQYPGMQGMGFQRAVASADLDAFLARTRADGRPDFALKPPGRRSEHYIVQYNEPTSRLGATWGFDARTNPTVRGVLEAARDTGEVRISGRAVLGVDLTLPKEKQPAAFGLFVPVYREGAPVTTLAERRSGFVGWASSPFRARDFLAAMSPQDGSALATELFDERITPETSIATSPARVSIPDGALERVERMDVGGRTWLVRFSSLNGGSGTSLVAVGIFVGGALLSLLVTSLLLLFLGERAIRRELVASDRRNQELVGELETSNVTLANFAHITSHDLAAPVRAVNGFLTLLERRHGDEMSPPARDFLEHAQTGGRRLDAMIRGVLDLATVDGSRREPKPVDVHRVVDDVLRDLSGRLEQSGAVVDVAPLPTLSGDAAQIRQLFENLVGNSLKYAGRDAPRIAIGADRDGDRWRLEVVDNGVGVDPAQAERAFEMFSRLHPGLDAEGTGIGLAICKRIVEVHGGRIWMEPSSTGGTAVRFTLTA